MVDVNTLNAYVNMAIDLVCAELKCDLPSDITFMITTKGHLVASVYAGMKLIDDKYFPFHIEEELILKIGDSSILVYIFVKKIFSQYLTSFN